MTPPESHEGGLTHVNEQGEARMVDVSAKSTTTRVAVASGCVRTRPDVIAAIRAGSVAKGDVLAVARVAGIMAAKRTPDWIPLCHPLQLSSVSVDLSLEESAVRITTRVGCHGQTGVEMEALTAASACALTIYDMCKAMDRAMVIETVQLEEKSGGKSGAYHRRPQGEPT